MADARRKLTGYRVYCDESNTDGKKAHPVYGAILVALDDVRAVHAEMGAVGFHNQDFHLRSNTSKYKLELARYIASRVGRPTLKLETSPVKEDIKIVRWHWPSSGPKPRYRRRAADNPRHGNRRPNGGK